MAIKALIEIEVTGEWKEPLSNDSIIDILTDVVCDGVESVGMDADFRIVRMIKEDEK